MGLKVVFLNKPKSKQPLARHVTVCAEAFVEGVRHLGDEAEIAPIGDDPPEADVYCLGGGYPPSLFRALRARRKHVLYFDKGYFRHRRIQPPGPTKASPELCWEYWRVSVNAHHPTRYLEVARHSPSRWDIIAKRHKVFFRDWRPGSEYILYAGSSQNYHKVAGLPHPTDVAQAVVAQINALKPGLPVMYRPKPNWAGAKPVRGALFHDPSQKMHHLLEGAACLVTFGSNAALDAMLAGVPSVILGEGILGPISSTSLEDVANPYLATRQERQQFLNNLMWRQFTEEEMRRGLAWAALRPELKGRMAEEDQMPFLAGSPTIAPAPRPVKITEDSVISWMPPSQFKRVMAKEKRRVSRVARRKAKKNGA